jgi:hypothetical protein
MTERDDGPLCAEAEQAAAEESQTPANAASATATAPLDEPVEDVPHRVGCRTELRGWAGAHLHGAVRPRRRAVGRGRPPGRWC